MVVMLIKYLPKSLQQCTSTPNVFFSLNNKDPPGSSTVRQATKEPGNPNHRLTEP